MDKTKKEREWWTKDQMRKNDANKIFIGNSETKANFFKAENLKTRYQDIKFIKFFREEMSTFRIYCNIKKCIWFFICFSALHLYFH